MAKADLSAQLARELLHYDPDTGLFHWKRRSVENSANLRACNAWNARCAGNEAGRINHGGYVLIDLYGSAYRAHRLAWLIAHGVWPSNDIDHINGVRSDNRLANLRDVTRRVNLQNLRGPKRAHDDLPLGVRWCRTNKTNPFRATIKRAGGGSAHIGYFRTVEEAQRAYLEAKRAHHEGCTI